MSLTDVRVPDIGDFTDVPVIEIHVSPGDEVEVEDPLVTLESDKATMDVPAPLAGVVKQLRVSIGDRVSEGSVLLSLQTDSAGATEAPATTTESARPTTESAAPPSKASAPPTEAAAPPTEAAAPPTEAAAPPTEAAAPPTEAAAPPTDDLPEPGAPSRRNGSRDTQVLVIGSGPGGYTAAFRAADLGLKTTLVERYTRLGGVCLNVGCIPSKALLHAARVIAEVEEMADRGVGFGDPEIEVASLMSWKQQTVARLTDGLATLARQRKVEVITGVARFEGPNAVRIGERSLSFENCIIATGSRPALLRDLPRDPRIIDSTDALSPDEIPRRLLVVGGGIIGLEMATVYDALGSQVTVVELLEQLMPGCDPDLVAPLQERIARRYDAVRLGLSVEGIEPQNSGLRVTLSDGSSEEFDRVLVAVGRKPTADELDPDAAGLNVDARGFVPVDNQMRTNVDGIFAIGDVAREPLLAHKATHEGRVAAEAIAGVEGASFDARAVPSVAYTDPEIAWMGLTETEAREQGIEYEKAVFPWSASGRALTLGRDDGLTKLLVEPGSSRVLGAGIVGVGAGELIAETVHALELGADAEDIALTIHPHPTLSETVGFSAEMAAGTITDLMPSRKPRSQQAAG